MSGVLFKLWNPPNPELTANWNWGPNDMEAWRYDAPLDLSNDGAPVRVMIWQGAGLSGGDIVCGATWNQDEWGFRPRQLPLILGPDSKQIDQAKTASVFAGRGRPAWVVGLPWVSPDSVFPFRPIGRSIGLFRYRDVVYFDTFFDLSGDDQGSRSGQPSLANTLGVFIRKQNATREICEYQMAGSDYPTIDRGE